MSCIKPITVTGSRNTGVDISKFILRGEIFQVCRDCKDHFEETNRPIVSFVRSRKIFNCEINVEFFKQNMDRCRLCEYHKNKLKKNETGERKCLSVPL